MMDRSALYEDIAKRTDGDIYIGVVGPVRTGKSTFIKRFMDLMVLPNMKNEFEKGRVTDELPQSAAGKTIMTTQPKFIPNEAVELQLEQNVAVRVRMIDCVGYMVSGASGHEENNAPRMVRTPWFEYDIPFEEAAELGTHKVICEHSTIGVVVITDGSITQIPRENYMDAEERVIAELKGQGKPFVIVLNSLNPETEGVKLSAASLCEKYATPVIPLDVMKMDMADIQALLYSVLMQFPLRLVKLNVPEWICALPSGHWLMERILAPLRECTINALKMCDGEALPEALGVIEDFEAPALRLLSPGRGMAEIELKPAPGLFYRIIGEECGCEISSDSQLVKTLKDYVAAKRKYDKLEAALEAAYATGYGVVGPDISKLSIDKPELMQRGGKYGVRINAHASGLHMIRVDIDSEISPLVGGEAQAEEFCAYLMDAYGTDSEKLWQTKIFGKPLYDLVCDELTAKAERMPQNTQLRLQNAVQRMVNDGCNGLICIVL